MKSRSFPWLPAIIALAGIHASAAADDAGVRRALQANYDRISAAFRERKPEVMEAMLTPDATLSTPDHQTWKRERIVADFKRQSSMMKGATWTRKVLSVAVQKNGAIATVKGRFHGSFSDKEGKTHVFDLDSLTVDTWWFSGSVWKLKHADTRELKAKVDGKAPPAGMQGHS